MTERVFHFTLGPVQGFVAQARRTRDLWAGSFLLSWLVGQALHAVVRKGPGGKERGRIEIPDVEKDPLFSALDGGGRGAAPGPRIGSLPNRFRAVITDPNFEAGTECEKVIREKWTELADYVWKTFVDDTAGDGCETKAIWDRQIENFWDMAWIIGPISSDSECGREDNRWLDQRKNWRSHWPSEEPGDHCMLMGDWQEISGFVRAREHQQQKDFWRALRDHISETIYRDAADKKVLELGKGERLCAIALVKRLFPVLFSRHMPQEVFTTAAEIIGFIPSGLPASEAREAHGEAVRAWRSTAHIAATPWLRRITQDHTGKCDEYFAAVAKLARDERAQGVIFAERAGAIPSLAKRPIAQIDGALFYHDSLLRKADRAWGPPLGSEDGDEAQAKKGLAIRKQLSKDLAQLQKETEPKGSAREAKGREARPFYAVLLMDGDSMGKLISEVGGELVSAALATFTAKAAELKGDHVTIYAGGDDYLGLFALPDVIGAAIELRQAYVEAFDADDKTESKWAISAGVMFAPYDEPLSQVIREAHELLDKIAKEENGRDSIAVRVLKSSGPMATWVSQWGDGEQMPKALMKLAKAMAKEDEHSSGYIYKLQNLYGEYYQDLPIDNDERKRLDKILLAERLVGRDATDNEVRRHAKDHVQAILGACLTTSKKSSKEITRFSLHGALIARFLADNGVTS